MKCVDNNICNCKKNCFCSKGFECCSEKNSKHLGICVRKGCCDKNLGLPLKKCLDNKQSCLNIEEKYTNYTNKYISYFKIILIIVLIVLLFLLIKYIYRPGIFNKK